VPAQGRDAEGRERNSSATTALGVIVVQDATAPLGLLADVQDPVFEVEVRPAKAHDLSSAETHGDGEHEGRVERVLARGGEEVEGLVQAPGLQLADVGSGRLNELGNVPRDQFLTAGRGQRRM
jgi:hypothetical protein